MSESFSQWRKPPAQANQSLMTGLDALMVVISAGQPIGCSEVAEELGVNPTKANRLLGTLASMGLIVQDPSRKYEPGPGLHVLAGLSLHGSRLLKVAMPELRQLTRETGYAAALGCLWRDRVCYLFHGMADGSMPAYQGPTLFPAAQSSIGRVLLSGLPAAVAADILTDHEPGGDYPSLAALLADLPAIAAQGYARRRFNGDSIAVPVGAAPAYAGLALAGVPADLDLGRLLPPLQTAAARIAAGMSRRG